MRIVTTALEPMAAYLLSSDAQTVSTLIAKSQSAEVEVSFEGNTGQCKDAEREVRWITPVPKMVNAINYSKLEEDVFTRCTPELGEMDSAFLINEHKDFQKSIVQDGRVIQMVNKTFQVFEGTSLKFEKSDNKMEDVFTITFAHHNAISATTWCDGEFTDITIKNGSRFRNPLQCGTFSPFHLFYRAADVRAEKPRREGKGLLMREMNSGGLVVTVEDNEVQKELNDTRVSFTTGVESSTWEFSLKNILMLAGGVAALTVGVMYYAGKFWVKNGRRQRSEKNVEAVAGTEVEAAGQLKELEYFGNIEADGGNGNRAIILSFPRFLVY